MCACPSVSVNFGEGLESKLRSLCFGPLKPRIVKNLLVPRAYLIPRSSESAQSPSESHSLKSKPITTVNFNQNIALNQKRRLKISSCINLRSSKSTDKLTQENSTKPPTPNGSFKIASSLNRGSTKDSRQSLKQGVVATEVKSQMQLKGSTFQSLFRSRQGSKKDIQINPVLQDKSVRAEVSLNLKRSGSDCRSVASSFTRKAEKRADSFEIDLVIPVPSKLSNSELDLPEDVRIPPARINTIRTVIDQSASKTQSVSSKFTGNRTGAEASDSVMCNLSKGSSRLRGRLNTAQANTSFTRGNEINPDLPKSAVMKIATDLYTKAQATAKLPDESDDSSSGIDEKQVPQLNLKPPTALPPHPAKYIYSLKDYQSFITDYMRRGAQNKPILLPNSIEQKRQPTRVYRADASGADLAHDPAQRQPDVQSPLRQAKKVSFDPFKVIINYDPLKL